MRLGSKASLSYLDSTLYDDAARTSTLTCVRSVTNSHRMSLRQFIPAVIVGLLLAALLLWLTLDWLLDAITRPVG